MTGGTDNMSACPYAVRDIRFGTKLGSDPKLVDIKTRKGVVSMTADEHPKPKTTVESIAKLPPVFKKGGVVTAASASGICDGAAAVVVASESAVKEQGLTPLARVVGYGL